MWDDPLLHFVRKEEQEEGQGVRPDSEGVTDRVAQVIDSGPGQVTKDVSALTDTLKTRGTRWCSGGERV